jgi:hypothetical protein
MSQPLNLVAMAASELLYIRSHSDCKKVNAKSRGSLCVAGAPILPSLHTFTL